MRVFCDLTRAPRLARGRPGEPAWVFCPEREPPRDRVPVSQCEGCPHCAKIEPHHETAALMRRIFPGVYEKLGAEVGPEPGAEAEGGTWPPEPVKRAKKDDGGGGGER